MFFPSWHFNLKISQNNISFAKDVFEWLKNSDFVSIP